MDNSVKCKAKSYPFLSYSSTVEIENIFRINYKIQIYIQ